MGKINIQIRDNYNLYKELTEITKIIKSPPPLLVITPKKSRPDIILDKFPVEHIHLSNKLFLLIEVKSHNAQSFKFQLLCSDLSEKPFFRYDSDGLAHHNKDLNVPLSDQKVETPHFNFFDRDGKSMAYRTRFLEDTSNSSTYLNLNGAFPHFCIETLLCSSTGNLPDISLTAPGTFPFSPNTESDPLHYAIHFPD